MTLKNIFYEFNSLDVGHKTLKHNYPDFLFLPHSAGGI